MELRTLPLLEYSTASLSVSTQVSFGFREPRIARFDFNEAEAVSVSLVACTANSAHRLASLVVFEQRPPSPKGLAP